jgi:hypothetical protein
MDFPPPLPVESDAPVVAPVAAPPKVPFVFPADEINELLEECKASDLETVVNESTIDTFNRLGASVVRVEGPNIEASFLAYAKTITNSKDKNPSKLAECGVFGPTHRFKNPQRIDGSISLTPHALFGGCKAAEHVKRHFGIEAQQLPSLFFVPPTAPPEDTDTSLWGFYDGASATSKALDDGCVPIALVAWTPVTIHFVPHAAHLRAKWKALTSGGGFNDHKLNATPFFRNELETILADWQTDKQETLSWALSPGQVFLTHNGMPFCLSATAEQPVADYVLQAVGFEVLKPRHKQKTWWRNALTTGTWPYNKDPGEMFCAYALTPSAEKNYEGYVPTFTPAKPDDVAWLTGGSEQQQSKKKGKPKAVAAAPVATAAVAVAAASSPASPMSPAATAAPTTGGDKGGGKLAVLFAVHDKYAAEIAALPLRVWDPKYEKHVNDHRAANDTERAKLNSYEKCLKTLKTNIDAAALSAENVAGILVQLQECKTILDEVKPAEDAIKLANSVTAAKKDYVECDIPDVVSKSKAIGKLLERCKKLKENIEADNAKKAAKKANGKRSRAPAASSSGGGAQPKSPLPDSFDPIDEEGLEEDTRVGTELAEFISIIDRADGKYAVMVKKIDREDIRAIYAKFHEEAAFLRNQVKEWPSEPINVAVISAYHDQLLSIWDKQAAAPSSASSGGGGGGKGKTSGTIELKDGSTIVFGGGERAKCKGEDKNGCGESVVIYANGMCKNCFFGDMKERRMFVSDLIKDVKTYAKEHAGDEAIAKKKDEFVSLCGPLEKARKKAKATKALFEPFITALVDAETIARELLGEEEGAVDENAEDAAEYMDEGSESESGSGNGSIEVPDDVISYESGSEQQDEDGDDDGDDAPRKKHKERKQKADAKEGEQDNLADFILRAQLRTPIEKAIKQLTTAYLNGDRESVHTKLKELGGLTKMFGIKTRAKGSDLPYIDWPHFFASEKKAEKKQAYLEKKMPSLEFVCYEKQI